MFFPSSVNWNINSPNISTNLQEKYPMSKYTEVMGHFQGHPLRKTPYCQLSDEPSQLSKQENTNLLEALNLCFNRFENSRVERLLTVTGESIFVITAGDGKYNVDLKLTRITKDRAINLGCNINLISMNRPPLHRVPLFLYRDSGMYRSEGSLGEM